MGSAGGFKRTCKELFAEFANQLPELDPNGPAPAAALRYRQGTTPDLIVDATSFDLPGE